jgi:hypothetical protein
MSLWKNSGCWIPPPAAKMIKADFMEDGALAASANAFLLIELFNP